MSIIEKLKKSYAVLVIWRLLGSKPPAPHIYKQLALKSLAREYKTDTLIESGTYLGDMVYALKNSFNKIYTIELSDFYYKKAVTRFKGNRRVNIVKGDSGKEIKRILSKMSEPCIFWLDGHYSSGKTAKGKLNTPIIQELSTIFKHKIKTHVVLIDDARLFNGKDDYPKISELKSLIKNVASQYQLLVKDDIIQITPNK